MKNDIVICCAKLSEKKEDVFNALKNDTILINAINGYKSELKKNNIEIFQQENNILITEDGYYIAVYAKELKKVKEQKK